MPAAIPAPGAVLLPPKVMGEVDGASIASGIPGLRLMENAGRAVTRAITTSFPPQPTLVLCGPGNNGGDGYVVARLLHAAGWPVRLISLVEPAALRGDAATMAAAWAGPIEVPQAEGALGSESLVVDALFGAGLARPLGGLAAHLVTRIAAESRAVVAVDIPSGVDGATGSIEGPAIGAQLTVTFCRAKPGHYLLPGRLRTGRLEIVDIGIPESIVAERQIGLWQNVPQLWHSALPARTPESHKYTFGHALVTGGPASATGAARLAARAALRAGAGLVSVGCAPGDLSVYAAQLTTIMTKPINGPAGLEALFGDRRMSAVLLGPGQGVGKATRDLAEVALTKGKPVVLDADALSSFAESPERLFGLLHRNCVLTPHDGEFARLFTATGSRLARAQAAAAASGAIVVLKGADTVVAAPDGRAAVMGQAPPALATAGTGDVLAGITLGLLAQGVAAFEAAAAAVWLHAALGARAGEGLIAEDLADLLPQVRRELDAT